MRGADALVRALVAQDVGTIFALSGNQIMPIFDAIFDTDLQLIHTRHEAATVYMAEAYAQLTGKVGVALVTAGGGLGNASGGLIAAQASDTPVLLLSGDSPVSGDGRGAFQEMNQTAMTDGLTKGSRLVLHADDMVKALLWAVDLAQSGRPGPVHLALPADALTQQTETKPTARVEDLSPNSAQLDMTAFNAAKHPLILLGPSLNSTRAPGLAQALQTTLQAPVAVMESPRGMGDPILGRFTDIAKMADHVLCIGKPVDFTLRFGQAEHWPNATTWDVVLGDEAQLATARLNLGGRLHTAILANPIPFAQSFMNGATAQHKRANWIAHVAEVTAARMSRSDADGILPIDICHAVQAVLGASPDPILICDGGEFGQWAQAFVQAPQRVINGVSGVIGGGLGYAIGAKAAHPAATVFACMGDGTIGFHLAEFETAARAGLPFVAVIGNDRRWNAEHLIQTNSFGPERRIGCELSGARYESVVAALGGFGAFVTRKDQLVEALNAAVQSERPACVNVEMQGMAAPNP